MARPTKQGLEYFPLDVDIFDDPKWLALEARHGAKGVMLVLKLVCLIYRNGYCLKFDSDAQTVFAHRHRVTVATLARVVHDAVALHLFLSAPWVENGYLTSRGIQRRWLEVARKRKDNELIENVWVLDSFPSGNSPETRRIAGVTAPETRRKLDKGKERERETERKVNKATHTKPDFNLIEYPPEYDTPEVRQSLKDWLGYKADRKEPYKSIGSIKALFTQAAKSKASPEMFCWAISYAMAKNWRGIGFYPEVVESFSGVAASNGRNKEPTGVFARLLAEAQEEERLEKLGLSHGVTN